MLSLCYTPRGRVLLWDLGEYGEACNLSMVVMVAEGSRESSAGECSVSIG